MYPVLVVQHETLNLLLEMHYSCPKIFKDPVGYLENYFIYGITNENPGSHADRWVREVDNKMTFFAKKGTCKLSEISILFIEESSK